MNKYKYYLFDLDGTISESALGIRESLENAIKSMGKPLPNLDDYDEIYLGYPHCTSDRRCSIHSAISAVSMRKNRQEALRFIVNTTTPRASL